MNKSKFLASMAARKICFRTDKQKEHLIMKNVVIMVLIAMALALTGCENPTSESAPSMPAGTGTDDNGDGTDTGSGNGDGTGTEEPPEPPAPVYVPVNGVSLNYEELTVAQGESATLVALIDPEDATNKEVVWTTSDSAIATVDDSGTVRGIAEGSATITVTAADGNKTADCTVTVTFPVRSIAVITPPNKTAYHFGEPLDLNGLVVTATFSDGSSSAVTISPQHVSIEGFDSVEGGLKTAVVSYGGVAPTTFNVTVMPVISLSLTNPVKTVYGLDEPLELAGLVVEANYKDGHAKPIAITKNDTSGFNSSIVGIKTITMSYGGKSASFSIIVRTLDHITVTSPPNKTEYYIDDPLVLQGLVVQAVYDDGTNNNTSDDVTSNITISKLDTATATAGTKNVTVTYGGKEAVFAITVRYKIIKVTVTSAVMEAVKGSVIPFAAEVQAEKGDDPPQTVTWSIIGSKAAGTSINPSGVLTVAREETVESLTVRATSIENSEVFDTVTISRFITPITNEAEWNAAMTKISNDNAGTANSPRIHKLALQGEFSVAGRTTANFSGKYKEVWLTGTGTASLSSNGSLIQTDTNQTFILDGPTLRGKSSNSQSTVVVGGAFTMESGTISGNTVRGGVEVLGTFTMNGGTINGNTSSIGGGVYVHGGTFTMNGGTISGNSANSPAPNNYGGGVYVGGRFTMNGGTISSNSANGGGGIYVNNYGTFTMEGGTISGNTNNSAAEIHGGGGVHVAAQGTFNLKNGRVSGNSAVHKGGGIFICGTFTMDGGEINDNSASDDFLGSGGGVYVYTGTFTMNGGTISDNLASGSDIWSGGGGVYVFAGKFTMNGPTGGTISNNSAINGGGVYVEARNGSFTMSGGEISGNSATGSKGTYSSSSVDQDTHGGGGVCIRVSTSESARNGHFTMTRGVISGNSATGTDSFGGGVFAYNSTFKMQGGTISGNSASFGGGVYSFSNISSYAYKKTGGTIYGQNATGNDASGIPLKNTATNQGSAIYTDSAISENTR
jgi:hypothetical protein